MDVLKKNVVWIAVIAMCLATYAAYNVYVANQAKKEGTATGFGGKIDVKNPVKA